MARTKKQTLVNACERRRQIQEEIRKETLAAKQKKENSSVSHSRENHSAARTKLPQNGVTVSGAALANVQKVNREKMDSNRDLSNTSVTYTVGICLSTGVGSQANMSSVTQASDSSSSPSLSEGDLPKAVICIPDICRSPTKSANEDTSLLDSSEQSSRSHGVCAKLSSNSHHVKQREDPVRKRLKQSDKYSSTDDVIESLKSLKAVSEKVREEKRRKSRNETGTTLLHTPSPGRRSPRRHSPVSSDPHQGISKKEHRDCRSTSDEKPRVNIFTDNLGLDLGKRIRSPRRLSEDMIALPIFSARRWSNSLKENHTGCKAVEEMSVSDGIDALSLNVNLHSESFKSPCVSPSSSKRANTSGTSHKTSPVPGSSKSNLSDELLTSMGSNSNEGYNSSYRSCSKSNENSPGTEVVPFDSVNVKYELEQQQHSHEGKLLASNQLLNVSQETPKTKCMIKSNRTLDFDDSDYFIFTSTPNHASVTDSRADISLECRTAGSNAAGIKIKKDKSKSQVQEDVEKRMSSICKEIMSDSVLVKCENRCANDANNLDINVKIDVSAVKNLGCQFNKENSAMKDAINLNINSDNSLQKANIDTDKEAAKNQASCVENSALENPLDLIEEKPPPSLLCAMLVGGKEVANSYSQERVRIKPQAMYTSDSELDLLKATSPQAVSRVPLPHPLTGSPELSSKENSFDIQMADSDKLDTKVSIENNNLEELVSVCEKNYSHEKKDAVTIKSEKFSTNDDTPVKMEEEVVKLHADNELPSAAKKCNINLRHQLKILNEDVLKLMEIDVEDEFLKELEVDETNCEVKVENLKVEAVGKEMNKTSLYSLISVLGSRLCNTDSLLPESDPVDVDLVESLMQSCPTSAPSVIPKLKTLSRMARIHKRLEEESLKDSSHCENKVSGFKGGESIYSEVDNQYSAITTKTIYLDSDQAPAQTLKPAETNVDTCDGKDGYVIHVGLDTTSSTKEVPESTLETVTPQISASSSLHDSQCDQSSDIKAPLAASSLNAALESSLQKSSQPQKSSFNADNALSNGGNAKKTSEVSVKHSFQKSKTCDDFSERPDLPTAGHAGPLRRINSSPQFSIKTSLLPASPLSQVACASKDSHTKSKLGSKIPVPGTSYIAKSKKSWRTPRSIVEPKPLSVLSELENNSLEPNSIFMCKNLHRYLNIPSNRIIVTPQRQEEMKILDAKAQEEAERMEMMEESDKMNDEENLDFKRFEPDFDEVDGMLFMSFSSEVELRAHVRVEKALEWDKDDTMLKVSRVKAFEEAKAQNEDMMHYKLKHLRGQHMRWKKYRRLYSNEVKALLEAQKTGQSFDDSTSPKKTLDISKIKGWKRKNSQASMMNSSDVNFNWSYDANSSFSEDVKVSCNQSFIDDDDLYFMSENLTVEDADTPDISTRSRRRQGFSHQKAHRQLFRELNMDWEDRMIHRKLGGWSLKGNRPQAFSTAAKKRQEKKSKQSDTIDSDIKDISAEGISFEDPEVEIETKALNEGQKKKGIKISYPLLTEKMIRNALKTLETGDIHRGMRKKKPPRQKSCQLPLLIPVKLKLEPRCDSPRTPMKEAASICVSPSVSLLTSSVAESCTPPRSTLVSTATTPLEIDLLDEPVMEGVDIASENISSPSITDSSSLKSCGKPGCRYGCICHLCSVSDASARPQSPVTKQPSPVCDKEYCRLGCICDSLDPDKPVSNKNHCRRPSCMLQCVCPESGNFDGNEDIPYLPSMKRRPKPGERFSNLPQREKTHRSAKNLDAVTRKAMMLYETSEIYCERVERVSKSKRPDTSSSPTTTFFDSTLHSSAVSPVSHTSVTCSNVTYDIDIASEPSEDSNLQEDMFKSEQLTTSETTPVIFSFPMATYSTGQQQQPCQDQSGISATRVSRQQPCQDQSGISATRVSKQQPCQDQSGISATRVSRQQPCQDQSGISATRVSRPTFVLDDIRQTIHVMEPSAHKRKRKSHPLSNEIFTSSTCARTQPFKHQHSSKQASSTVAGEDAEVIEVSPPSSADPMSPSVCSTPVSTKSSGLKFTNSDSEPRQILPKISSVHTLASRQSIGLQHWDHLESEVSPSSQSSVAYSGPTSSKWAQNMTVHKQVSHSGASICEGNLRQPHGWHKSMVCLKARAPPSSQDQEKEDVQEEGEVKLLEFAANCNWEGAKNEIVTKLAQCLTRGQYPQTRTMNVCEFVVEILPKGHQPSRIPPQLRAKLPGQMYPIRVRITRRESVNSRREDHPDVIDLSGLSPVKSARANDCGDSSVGKNMKEKDSGTAHHKPVATSSSFGISGFSNLFITSPPQLGQNNQNSSDQGVDHVSKSLSEPNSRRSSMDATAFNLTDDHRQSTNSPSIPASPSPGVKIKGSSFMRLDGSSSLKTSVDSSYNSENAKAVTNTAKSSKLKLTNTTASTKSGLKALNMAIPKHIAAKTASSVVSPIFGPFSAKDVKYMIPGKDGTMQLIEVSSAASKNKIIAVPITLSKTQMDLQCKQKTVVALPASGMSQSRIVPLINSQSMPSQLKTGPGQKIVLRLPGTSNSTPGVPSVRHPVVLQPMQSSIKGQPSRFQVVPLQLGGCMSVPQAKVTTKACRKSATSASKALNSSDEMIMVFDAAHIRASHQSASSVSQHTSTSKTDQSYSTDQSVTVTNSLEGPVTSSEISPGKLQTHINGTIDLSAEKVPLENVQTIPADGSRSLIEIDDDDDSVNNTSDQVDPVYGNEQIDSTSEGDSSIKIPTKDIDLCLQVSALSSPLAQEEDKCSPQTEVDSSKSTDTLDSTLIARNLSEVQSRTDMPQEVAAIKRNSSPSSYLNSPARDVQQLAKAGLKRHIPASSEESVSPCKKKACLVTENPIILDEDSATSLNSMSGGQLAASIDRPKSVMSGALSTGSSDDLLVLLSSEEEVDVGEEDKPDKAISYKSRAERALENDHGNMYTRMDQVVSLIQGNMKIPPEDGVKSNGLRYEDKDYSKSLDKELQRFGGKNLQKVRHHNQLERLRRSRMRALFDDLQQHVLSERGLPKDHVMSKVKVLVEAKRVVQQLSKCVLAGDELVKKHEKKHIFLVAKLAELKANLMRNNVSTETICSVIKQASEKYLSQSTNISAVQPDEKSELADSSVDKLVSVEVDVDHSQEMASCTEVEKVFSRQVDASNLTYEDIDDPEDLSALKYEEISNTEENAIKNEIIMWNSQDTV